MFERTDKKITVKDVEITIKEPSAIVMLGVRNKFKNTNESDTEKMLDVIAEFLEVCMVNPKQTKAQILDYESSALMELFDKVADAFALTAKK